MNIAFGGESHADSSARPVSFRRTNRENRGADGESRRLRERYRKRASSRERERSVRRASSARPPCASGSGGRGRRASRRRFPEKNPARDSAMLPPSFSTSAVGSDASAANLDHRWEWICSISVSAADLERHLESLQLEIVGQRARHVLERPRRARPPALISKEKFFAWLSMPPTIQFRISAREKVRTPASGAPE